MLLEYHIDHLGFRRINVLPELELLASYLEQDIQSSVNGCDIMLEYLSDVEEGKRVPFDATGNAHNVWIAPDKIVLEPLWIEPPPPPLEITPEQYRQALQEWRAFILATPEIPSWEHPRSNTARANN